MSYGGELSGRRRYSALVWTAQEQLRPTAPPEPDLPARFPVVWAGLWRDRPGQFPVSRLGFEPEGYRVLSPSPSKQLKMAREATGRAELGFVTNGLHQESGGTNGTSAGARRELEDAEPVVRKTLDPNRYATKKTIAQGMLDVALLTANASQLRYVLQVGEEHEFYTLMVTLISLSIILQVLIGVLSLSLNLLRDCRMDREDYARSANGINYTTLAFVFVITTTNVLISAFDCLQAITNVVLSRLDARDTTRTRLLAREYLNHLTLALALFTVCMDAIRTGFGLDVQPTRRILVGVLLMVLGALDINDESPTQMAADIINDVTVIMVFIITLLNVIIASFGIETTHRLFVTASPAPEAV
ncbi:Ninjurin-1 [Amphibalanus amphitrite]|uniref:Ninjurin-1 n=1 Tax=Amphibalanus amphitrite TaxID=1232801 RepID=A0A6A4X7E2_AMPAM|nr:Ninjurin-1 [Amphibalanus amphitrite]